MQRTQATICTKLYGVISLKHRIILTYIHFTNNLLLNALRRLCTVSLATIAYKTNATYAPGPSQVQVTVSSLLG
jgi:hypothetical protein